MVSVWLCWMEKWSKMRPMKWKKLGKIFDPTHHKLPNDCVQFAQSPQALVFDDFVRIYFSTRSVDKTNGKYLSHIAFVDMQKICPVSFVYRTKRLSRLVSSVALMSMESFQ